MAATIGVVMGPPVRKGVKTKKAPAAQKAEQNGADEVQEKADVSYLAVRARMQVLTGRLHLIVTQNQ
jgi:hypothetical protein